ncbi:MAG: hypothetical protein IKP65_01985 [Alphaproteobacteria bacterium]|nr:hypothetical protein [Alphaproteobacteria bacterium]
MKLFALTMQDVTNPYDLKVAIYQSKQSAINAVLDIFKQEHDDCNIYGEPGDYSLIEEQLGKIDDALYFYNEYSQEGDNRLFSIKETYLMED